MIQKKDLRKFNWKVLIVSLVIVYFVAYIGSLFTSNSVKSGWYQGIKPSITPPNYVFPIVWNILFFLIALSLYFAWVSATKKEKRDIALIYGLNFVLNILWSVFYFGLKNPMLAFLEIIILWLSIFGMISVAWRISRKASYLLIPYLIWVSFAVMLNFLSIK